MFRFLKRLLESRTKGDARAKSQAGAPRTVHVQHDDLDFEEEVERELDDLVGLYSEMRFSDSSSGSMQSQFANNSGIALEKAGDLDGAEKMFLRAIEIWPECINAYRNLGALYHKQGDSQKAKAMLERAKILDETLPKYVLRPEKRKEFGELFRDSVERQVRKRRQARDARRGKQP